MILGARILVDVGNVNTFRYAQYAEFTEMESYTLYFQLVDLSKDTENKPLGRRYMPATGAVLSVVIDNIDDARKITKTATQPFINDPSIWSVNILDSDSLRAGTKALKLTLTEGTAISRGICKSAIRVASYSCMPIP